MSDLFHAPDHPAGFGARKSRVHNPDRLRTEAVRLDRTVQRVQIKTHRALQGRTDYTADERTWMGRLYERLSAIHTELAGLVAEADAVVTVRARRYRRKVGPVVGTGVLLVALAATLGASPDWSQTLTPIQSGIGRIAAQATPTSNPTTCSGAQINPKGFAVTAAHCVDAASVAVTWNGRHAEVLKANRLIDLAVVGFDPEAEEAVVPLAAANPKPYSDVAILGFSFGDRQCRSHFGHVSAVPENDVLLVDGMAIGGDSGGAAVTPAGELAGVVIAVRGRGAFMHMAEIVPIETVRKFVKAYLPAAK